MNQLNSFLNLLYTNPGVVTAVVAILTFLVVLFVAFRYTREQGNFAKMQRKKIKDETLHKLKGDIDACFYQAANNTWGVQITNTGEAILKNVTCQARAADVGNNPLTEEKIRKYFPRTMQCRDTIYIKFGRAMGCANTLEFRFDWVTEKGKKADKVCTLSFP